MVAATGRSVAETTQTINSQVVQPGKVDGSGNALLRIGRSPGNSAVPSPRYEGGMPIPSDAVIFHEESGKSSSRAVAADAVRQGPRLVTANSSNLLHSFQGLDDNLSFVPPDVAGVVGLNDVMLAHNSEVRIQTKAGKQRLRSTLLDWWKTYFASLTNVVSPRVAYDPYSNRWIMSAAAEPRSANACVLVAASMTSDPTGTWRAVRLTADNAGTSWSDQPRMGFNKDWIVVGTNLYANADDAYNTSKLYVLTKAELYASSGVVAAARVFTDSNWVGTLPCTTYDSSTPVLYMAQNWNGPAGYTRISHISGLVGAESATADGFPTLGTGNEWADAGPTAPQQGNNPGIDTGDSRINSACYRDGAIWYAQTVFLPSTSPTRASVQWWKVDPVARTVNHGRIDDASATVFRAYPSLAVNANGTMLLGYSRFSGTTFPSAAYAIHNAGDPVSAIQPEVIAKAGVGGYFVLSSSKENRWGDYSTTSVDPANDVDLWTLQEYADTGNHWASWWAAVSVVPDGGRLSNLSVRTNAGTGDNTLIVGVVVGGSGTSGAKPLLIRGVGPTLTGYGVAGALTDPSLQFLLQGTITPLATDDDWSGDAQIRSAANAVGAFPLVSDTSKDAALYLSAANGVYSVKVTGVGGTTGIALAEIYDASGAFLSTTPRLINVSARAQVGTGDGVLIAGFVVAGTAPRTVLIRGVGPTLGAYGVGGALLDPQLELTKTVNGSPVVVASNDDWEGDSQVSALGAAVGAFALSTASSKDAALLVTLPPGVYSAKVSGVGGSTGVALVEVYEIP